MITKILILTSVALSAFANWMMPKAQPAPKNAINPIPPMPDPEESLESYYKWADWAAKYNPWSLT